jgi:hypothetical protein
VTAAIAIGLPDAAFLGGFYGYMAVVRRITPRETDVLWAPELDPGAILAGAMIGIAAALYVVAIMRGGWRRVARKSTSSAVAEPTPTRAMVERGRVSDRRVSAW